MKRLGLLVVFAAVACAPIKPPPPAPAWWYDVVSVNKAGSVRVDCTDQNGAQASHVFTFPTSEEYGAPDLFNIYNHQLGYWGEDPYGHGGGPVLGPVSTCTVTSLSGPATYGWSNVYPAPVGNGNTCTYTPEEQYIDQGIEIYNCFFTVQFGVTP